MMLLAKPYGKKKWRYCLPSFALKGKKNENWDILSVITRNGIRPAVRRR